MNTETITIRVAPETARVLNTTSANQRRKLEALLSLRLLELAQQGESLEEVMRDTGDAQHALDLTPSM